MSFNGLLNMSVAVQRPQTLPGPGGETRRDYQTVATGVMTAIQRASGRWQQRDPGTDNAKVMWAAFLPSSADVQNGDRLYDGTKTYLVVLVEDLRGHHKEAGLAEVAV